MLLFKVHNILTNKMSKNIYVEKLSKILDINFINEFLILVSQKM